MQINKEVEYFNNTIDQLDPIMIYRTLHPTIVENTFFSSAMRHS